MLPVQFQSCRFSAQIGGSVPQVDAGLPVTGTAPAVACSTIDLQYGLVVD